MGLLSSAGFEDVAAFRIRDSVPPMFGDPGAAILTPMDVKRTLRRCAPRASARLPAACFTVPVRPTSVPGPLAGTDGFVGCFIRTGYGQRRGHSSDVREARSGT